MKDITEEDVAEIVLMARAFHAESGVSARFSEERFLSTLQHCMLNGFAMRTTNGFMLGAVFPDFYTEELTASEICLYTTPNKRGGIQAARMVNTFKQWAKDTGAYKITAGVSAGINDHVAQGLYNRLGFVQNGVVFHFPV